MARFPFFNPMNNEDSFGQILLQPVRGLSLRSDVHYLRLSNRRDLWYVGGGAFQEGAFGYVPRDAHALSESQETARGSKSAGISKRRRCTCCRVREALVIKCCAELGCDTFCRRRRMRCTATVTTPSASSFSSNGDTGSAV